MIAVYLDPATSKYSLQVEFALEYLLNTSGFTWKLLDEKTDLKPNDVILYYSPLMPDPKSVTLMNQMFLFIYIPYVKEFYIPGVFCGENLRYNLRTYEHDDTEIPYICSKRVQGSPIHLPTQDGYKYGVYEFDVIGNAFFHLADDDRNHLRNKDKNQNLSFAELGFNEYFDVPYVNFYVDGLYKTIKQLIEYKKKWQICRCQWPNNEPFAATISHNLNSLQKWNLLSILQFIFLFGWLIDILKLRIGVFFKKFWSICRFLFTNREDYFNFYNILQIERKHRFLSTWYVGVNKSHQKEKLYDYEIDDEDVLAELLEIVKLGSDVCLLDNNVNKALNDIKVEYDFLANRLKISKTGIRHKDYFGEMEHLDPIHQDFNLKYDSSRTLPDRNAFYNGFCLPYPIFIKNKVSSGHFVYELPVNFSDKFLQLKKYKFVTLSDAMTKVKNILNAIKQVKGLLHMSFTNSLFYEIKYMPKLLEYIVDDLHDQNAFVTTGSALVQWMVKRSKVEVLEDENNLIVLHFLEDIDDICYEILGAKKPVEVYGGFVNIRGNIIHFSNVTKGLRVEIKLVDAEIES